MASTSRDMVLGFCANYSFDKVEPFIASFLNSGAGQTLCLFTANMDDRFHEMALRFGIRVEDATPWLNTNYHVQNVRYFMYRDFLRYNHLDIDRVFLSDIRDAFFQGNPFHAYFPSELAISIEDIAIATDTTNSDWISDLFGPDILADIDSNLIACSGTTRGTIEAMILYLDTLCDLMAGRDFIRKHCYDQGFHNYIAWKQRPAYAVIDRDDIIVQTVGCTQPGKIAIDKGVVLVDGCFAPVIHQWDRHALLIDHVRTHPRFRIPA